jgi:hypothetical protein
MTCQLKKDGMLEVVSFHEQHNHEFAPSPMKHMLRSTRQITLAQKYAEVGAIKDYRGVDINANSQELIEKHYPHLSQNFHEIKMCYSSGVEGQLEVHSEAIKGTSPMRM